MPAGLFLPGILIGCGFGQLAGQFVNEFIYYDEENLVLYAIMGAAGILAGYSRLSFSLTVLMMETAVNVNLFLPTLITVVASLQGGEMLTRSLYVDAIKKKNIPFLVETCPRKNRVFRAKDIMSRPVRFVHENENVAEIYALLKRYRHNGFPVIEPFTQQLRGMITRNQLITLIKNKQFTADRRSITSIPKHQSLNRDSWVLLDNEVVDGARPLNWSDFNVSLHSREQDIDECRDICKQYADEYLYLGPFMNFKPYVVGENTDLQRLLSIFRLMNLRHCPVISNEDGQLKGMLTRKDIFKYL